MAEQNVEVEIYSLRRMLPGGLLLLAPPLYLAYLVAATTPFSSFSSLDLVSIGAGVGVELFGFLSVIGWRKSVGAAAMVLPFAYAAYRDYYLLLLPAPGFEQWIPAAAAVVSVACGAVLVFWEEIKRAGNRSRGKGAKAKKRAEEAVETE
jgi:hypothetical protein